MARVPAYSGRPWPAATRPARPSQQGDSMHAPIKYVEKGLSIAASGAWHLFNAANRIGRNASFVPRGSARPLRKPWEKPKPPLGWPRQTDSLCPTCVREVHVG